VTKQILGLTLAEMSILLLPLDVANRSACADSIVLSACNFALPMEILWYTVYMAMFVMMVAIVPFTLFYYEQDHDMSVWGKTVSSSWWIGGTITVLSLILGLCYGFLGFVDFPVTTLTSGLAPLSSAALTTAHKCLAPDAFSDGGTNAGYACDADGGVPSETWSVRTTFPIYVIAVGSVLSWVIFIVFGGVGVSAVPIDLIKAFLDRPKKTIAKSEYIRIAGKIAEATRAVVADAREVQREERGSGKTRKTRRALAEINKRLSQLEGDEAILQKMYPQGEDRDVSWTVTVMSYYASLVGGVVCAVVSLLWMLHIGEIPFIFPSTFFFIGVCMGDWTDDVFCLLTPGLYMFPDPPLTPFLNQYFVDMDAAFGLLGTGSFALFCFYLIVCVIKGNVKVGFRLLLWTVYPMRLGNTLMSAFLVRSSP
jgi:LMBR1 domain-containing protein 1